MVVASFLNPETTRISPPPLHAIEFCYLVIKDTMKDEKHNSLQKYNNDVKE